MEQTTMRQVIDRLRELYRSNLEGFEKNYNDRDCLRMSRLIDFAKGEEPTTEESQHLQTCGYCRRFKDKLANTKF